MAGGYVAGARDLAVLQLLSRGCSFVMNAFIARSLGPEWYGVSQVQLQLLSSTVLFLSREPLRRAAQRTFSSSPAAFQHCVTLMSLAAPICVLLSVGLLAVGVYVQGDAQELGEAAEQTLDRRDYLVGAALLFLAAAVESLGEPGWLFAQTHLESLRHRVVAESLSVLARSVATVALLVALPHQESFGRVTLLGFAQLLGACVFVSVLYARLQSAAKRREGGVDVKKLWPRKAQDGRWIGDEQMALAKSFTLHTVQKYVLTEGEKLVLVNLSPLRDQGVFALVSNLGSLVARIVLQPIEEMVFAYFSGAKENDKNVTVVVLASLVRGAILFGAVFAAFGGPYSELLLRIVYGQRWEDTAAAETLSLYCVYILFLSVNGISEAFVHATSDGDGIRRLNLSMLPMSVVYIIAAAAGIRSLGVVGLLLASVLSMLLRILYSVSVVLHRYPTILGRQGTQFLPKLMSAASVVLASFICWTTRPTECVSPDRDGLSAVISVHGPHVALGCATLGMTLALWWYLEHDIITHVRDVRKKKE
mmetsp:Transcript_10641/g.40061  ORF Transcript_10641/g.40061 Transcript_10641/m.40061 type:complete len:534 (-) Transcript_10641:309-1910(-)